VALCHQVRVVDSSRLKALQGVLSPTAMEGIDQKMAFTLAL
jgi:mRNA-degrading endonuclease toxin of MazEF toxin-antitoxin module